MDRFYLLVGLVPCYSVCHLLPDFFDRGFPTILPPPSPFPWTLPLTDAVGLPTQFSLIPRVT